MIDLRPKYLIYHWLNTVTTKACDECVILDKEGKKLSWYRLKRLRLLVWIILRTKDYF